MGILFLAVVGLFIWTLRLQARVFELEQRDEERLAGLDALRAQLAERATARPEMPATATERAVPRASVAAPPPSVGQSPPEWAPARFAVPPVPTLPAPVPPAARPPVAGPPTPPPSPAPSEATPSPAAAAPSVALPPAPRLMPRPLSRPRHPAAPPSPPPPTGRSEVVSAEPPPSEPFDWEALVGVKLFSWVAGIALALAAIFFLGYSIQNGWLQAPVRMAVGIVVGVGLLVACELRVARRYAVTANAMDAAGIVILFSTFFASHALWHLLPAVTTFALLVLVTVVAVTLSIRRDSVFVALLGLVGGFSTPALLSTGQDNPVGLFGYLLLLNAGLAWVAYRKRWVTLTALSLAFTTLYQWGWVFRFFGSERLPLGLGIFLVFPLVGVAAFALFGRGRDDGETPDPTGYVPGSARRAFGLLTALNAALPLLFALHLAAVPAYGAHYWLLFGFLLIVDAGLFAIARWRGPQWLHLVGAASTIAVFLAWLSSTYGGIEPSGAWPDILAVVALFVAFFLGCDLAASHGSRRLERPATFAVYAAPLLLVVFPVLATNEPAFASPGTGFGALFALLGLTAAYAIAHSAGRVYFLAAFLALATEAAWSGVHLAPERLLSALIVYGGFGLFYLGVPIVARRVGRPLQPAAMPSTLLLASIALLFFLSIGAVAASSLWGLALLLALLNLAMFVEGRESRRRWVLPAASGLSWLVLAAWWLSGGLATQAVAAMTIVGGFSVLTLGGHLWSAARDGDGATQASGLGLALVGHVFLFFVAAQPSLSVPPWPMLGVLGVLDLAIAVAALHVRRGEAFFGAVALTQALLILWTFATTTTGGIPQADVARFALVGILAAAGTCALALGWAPLARRRVSGETVQLFDVCAATAVLLAQTLLIIAAFTPGAPGVGVLALFHVLFAVALLALATLAQWPAITLIAVLPAWIATWSWQALHPAPDRWWENLEFAAPLYAVFLCYPLVLGRRVRTRLEPHLAAVLASASFFHVARLGLVAGGFGGVIGALPVVEAVLLGALVVGLLRIERPGERALGRLALVAGAALAFITLAIPLQLEK